MAQLYMNFLCNLAATAFANCSGGLFYNRHSLISTLKILPPRDGMKEASQAASKISNSTNIPATIGKQIEIIDSGLHEREVASAPLNRVSLQQPNPNYAFKLTISSELGSSKR